MRKAKIALALALYGAGVWLGWQAYAAINGNGAVPVDSFHYSNADRRDLMKLAYYASGEFKHKKKRKV